MEIFEQFGIDWRLLLVQLINFVIAAAVLMKFVLPRLTKVLDDRRHKIEAALAEAKKAREEVAAAQATRDQELARSRQQAQAMIAEAKESASRESAEIVAKARQDAVNLSERTRRQLETDRQKLRAELREELAELTVATTRRVLQDVVTPADRDRMVEAAAVHLAEQPRTPSGQARTTSPKKTTSTPRRRRG